MGVHGSFGLWVCNASGEAAVKDPARAWLAAGRRGRQLDLRAAETHVCQLPIAQAAQPAGGKTPKAPIHVGEPSALQGAAQTFGKTIAAGAARQYRAWETPHDRLHPTPGWWSGVL
jgi:hypothetical protein